MAGLKGDPKVARIFQEGGDRGGKIVAHGTPEQVAQNKDSYTGQFLKQVLK